MKTLHSLLLACFLSFPLAAQYTEYTTYPDGPEEYDVPNAPHGELIRDDSRGILSLAADDVFLPLGGTIVEVRFLMQVRIDAPLPERVDFYLWGYATDRQNPTGIWIELPDLLVVSARPTRSLAASLTNAYSQYEIVVRLDAVIPVAGRTWAVSMRPVATARVPENGWIIQLSGINRGNMMAVSFDAPREPSRWNGFRFGGSFGFTLFVDHGN